MHAISSTWSELLGQFFQMFAKPGADIFLSLMTGWVLCAARRTVTGMLSFARPTCEHAHDAYHRFFPDARWAISQLWQTLTLILVARFCPKGIVTLALDDTLFHHTGRKINGAGYWRDAVRSTKKSTVYAWGLNLVVLTLQIQPPWADEPLGLPINMRLHWKKQKTLVELAVEMLQQVCKWLPQRAIRVVGDGFYATLAGKPLPNVTIISRIRRDARPYDLPPKRKTKRRGRPRTKGKKLSKLEKMAAHIQNWKIIIFSQRGTMVEHLVYTRVVLWPSVSRHPIRLVISRDPQSKEKDNFFFTTDIEMSPADALSCYCDRWAIEDTFKQTKQSLGARQRQSYKGKGPERAAALGLRLYSMVWLWYINQKSSHKYYLVRPWYRQKSTPSFADALSCLRRKLWRQRMKGMFGNSSVHDNKLDFLIEALANAA
ncbi:MAG: IS701 family transposase [Planctomycetota bacterium]|jgi:hypothetical protein